MPSMIKHSIEPLNGVSQEPVVGELATMILDGDITTDYVFFNDSYTIHWIIKMLVLIIGVVFIPVMGIGLKWIKWVVGLGPVFSNTIVSHQRHYIDRHRSLIEFEFHNDELISSELTRLSKNARINGYYETSGEYSKMKAFNIRQGSKVIDLSSDFWIGETVFNRRAKFNEVYQRVVELSKILDVEIAIPNSWKEMID
tara:strand:+ start:114 stop:707 length:594 start_codon:yes stop_codon:yes gene_type:complete